MACVKHWTDTLDTVQLSLVGVTVELLLVALRFWRLLCIEMFFLPLRPHLVLTAATFIRTAGWVEGEAEQKMGVGGSSWWGGNKSTPHLKKGTSKDLNEFWRTLGSAHQYSPLALNQHPKTEWDTWSWSHASMTKELDTNEKAGDRCTNPEQCWAESLTKVKPFKSHVSARVAFKLSEKNEYSYQGCSD